MNARASFLLVCAAIGGGSGGTFACSSDDKPAAVGSGGDVGNAGTHAAAGDTETSGGTPALEGDAAGAGGAAGAAESMPEGGAGGAESPESSGGVPGVCNQGKGAVVRGRVTSPSGELPLAGVAAYVPSSTVDALPSGTGCWRCQTALVGKPRALAFTSTDGSFELDNVPAGDKVPLVIQTGKWRRTLELEVVDCQENLVADDDARLPSKRSLGNLPHIALVSGGEDTLECLLRKLGIDDSEFGTSFSDARVRIFQGKGGMDGLAADAQTKLDPASALWTKPAPLSNFDLVLLGSETDQNAADKTADARAALHEYVATGGRLLVQHFQNYFLSAGAEDVSSVATFSQEADLTDPFQVKVDQSSERGRQLAASLHALDLQGSLGQLAVHSGRNSVTAVKAPALRLLYGESPATVQAYSQDLSNDAGQPACGRLTETELLTSAGDSVAVFPNGCKSSGLTAQERALAYLLFDLGACLP
ncbi:MAG TPA: hypothetical protein VHB79_21570 [Polyangiaceae bacterium]|nr:hypothetical protein [Polyangiaceae bacterium]